MTTLTRPRLDPLIDAPLLGPRVLSLVGDQSGCALWRVWWPTRTLRLHGYPCDWALVADLDLPRVAFERYDAIVLCRVAWHRHERRGAKGWLADRHRLGQKVFFEADDDLFTPFGIHHQLQRPDKRMTLPELEADREGALWALAHCDGVTVSTQYLASTVRRFTDAPVEVVPNAIDPGWFTEQQAGVARIDPRLTIGWAGGGRPDGDLAQMAEAWGRIARRYPDVVFAVFGYHPDVIRRHVPPERLRLVPWLHPNDYPKGLVGIDIGCCPLEDHPFNRSKSPIKAWEYALSGAAVVASPMVYRHCIDIGKTGYLPASVDWWEHDLSRLLEDEGHRRQMAADLKRDVLERWSLRKDYWRWPLAWNRLWRG